METRSLDRIPTVTAIIERRFRDDMEKQTDCIIGELLVSLFPLGYFPSWLRNKGRESEPVKVFVLFEVSKGDY